MALEQEGTAPPLTTAALAAHDQNQHAIIQEEEQARQACATAVQYAAQTMGADLPRENPYTGGRVGEGWIESQTRAHGRYIRYEAKD